MEHEVVQIQSAFNVISPEYNPKFAFIVVKKRINHRFFMPGRFDDALRARMMRESRRVNALNPFAGNSLEKDKSRDG